MAQMPEQIFGKRRPLVPRFEPLFEAAHSVDDAVIEMRRQIVAADAWCSRLEDTAAADRPTFNAIVAVDAAILQLRNEISDAAIYCTALEKMTRELHTASVTEDAFVKPRLLTGGGEQ
jgi:hypothetical protein